MFDPFCLQQVWLHGLEWLLTATSLDISFLFPLLSSATTGMNSYDY